MTFNEIFWWAVGIGYVLLAAVVVTRPWASFHRHRLDAFGFGNKTVYQRKPKGGP